jgi:hypothetical protein
MERQCIRYNLLNLEGGLVRVPFLIKGKLLVPPEIGKQEIESAFSQADETITCVKLAGGQVVREPVIDRKTMKYTGEYLYLVMPSVCGSALIETDTDKLVHELYALSVDNILDYLAAVLSTIEAGNRLISQISEISRLTSEYPDTFLDNWFNSFQLTFSREAALKMIDTELSFGERPGSDFLNGWVDIPASISPGCFHICNLFAKGISDSAKEVKYSIRAMPTRQLHITAGNTPDVPLVSALRAVLTKSAAVIKLPYGACLTGALFALAAVAAAPNHPVTKNLSMVYWQGGDESVENTLFKSNGFDRIVVWGSPETVSAIKSKALARVICLDPRYGVSLIGKQAFSGNIEETAAKASLDVMLYNQKACTSSLVHYVESTEEQANEYAQSLCNLLGKWDKEIPNFVQPSAIGQIKRMRRGRYANARWYINKDCSSGVVVISGEFDILNHPMCRIVVVRPVAKLEDSLRYMNRYVSTVGVYPEGRRLELKDRILAKGVSSVFSLGQCDSVYAGMPHDGMRILSELVDWKNS